MKKILLFASALAGLFLVGSCQRENLEPMESANTVTYTVTVPDALATKGIGDDVSNVNTLHYEVYRTVSAETVDFTDADRLLYHKTATAQSAGTFKIELELVNDQNFTVLFWAQVGETNEAYDVTKLTEVKLKSSLNANQVNYAAFSGVDFIKSTEALVDKTVELKRPVAQVNLGTTEASLNAFKTPITLDGSSVTVAGLSNTFDVASQAASGTLTSTTEYDKETVPTVKLTVNSTDYVYVGMNYVGFAPEVGTPVTVSYVINTTEGDIANTIENVPVKPNYRTNIIGNLITSKTAYTIELDETWGDAGKNMEVLAEGLVKNINGDYEVSTAKGLAYAINNLWAEGGNFYLTAAEYDMTGLNVTPAVIADGKTLNIYGETPVVTRAMTSIAGITIKGLDSIIDTIEDGANVSISGVELVDEGSVLVENNSGTLVVSESTGEENVVRNGNPPVEADKVKDLATLKAALISAVKTIDIAADIEANEIVEVKRSVVINGNDHKITSSASRGIALDANNIEITINNLDVVMTAERVGTNNIRGFNITPNNVVNLTLNDCTVDFTHESAHDWTYAVNQTAGEGNTIIINGGMYEGANVINIWGSNHKITIDGAILTSLYKPNELYTGVCVNLNADANNSSTGNLVTIKNSVLNGEHAIPTYDMGEGNQMITENITDNTRFCPIRVVGGDFYYTLADAIKAIEKEGTIKFCNTVNIESVNIPTGKNITFDLNDNILAGESSKTGKNYDMIDVRGTLTVENGTLTAEFKGENMLWNNSTNVFNVTAGGVLNLDTVTAKNLGGSDMGFVAHLNNWGEVTLNVENSTLESNYVAVRVFNSGYDKNNVTIKNSTLKGGNYAFWVHNYTVADFGTVEKAIAQQKLLNFNLTEGNTFVGKNDTPIRLGMTDAIYLAADQIGNLPTYASVDSEETLIAALKNASTVNSIIYFANDITISNKWDNRSTGAKTSKPIEINGNGKTLKFTGLIEDMNHFSVFRFQNVATVKNLTIDLSEAANTGQMRAISCKSTLSVENCTFIGKSDVNSRGIIFGEGANPNFDFGVSIKNSTFTNWKRGITDNENAQDIKSVTVAGNTFNNAHAYMSAYESVTFTGNTMNNSCVNIKSYSAPDSVIITVEDNDLDENQDNKF